MDLKSAINELCDCSYPVSVESVNEQCDIEFELPNGDTASLEDVLNTGEPPEEFRTEEELFNYVVSLAPAESVGRQNYDDRGGSPKNDDRDIVSF